VWKDGRKVSAPRITVHHNGVLIHSDFEIPYATAHSLPARDKEPQRDGPPRLQEHSNAIQFRNIWIVPARAE